MVDRVDIDTSQLRTLSADLSAAGADLPAKVGTVLKRGGANIRQQMRGEMAGSGYFGQLARTITYDLKGTAGAGGSGVLEVEVGPVTGPNMPGNLANIAYFGSARGGGTVPDPQGALDAEQPRFGAALEALFDEIL